MINHETEEGHAFAIAHYRWALEQWVHEVDHSFPLLHAVHNVGTVVLVGLLESLSRDRRLQIGRLLAIRAHSQADWELEAPPTIEEINLLEWLHEERWKAYDRMRIGLRQADPAVMKVLKKEIAGAIEPILGTRRERLGRNGWYYRTAVGRWTIGTAVEFGVRGYDMTYSHSIDATAKDETRLAYELSALGWLGVSSSSDWEDLCEADVPDAVAGLTLVCRRFIEAAPLLLPKRGEGDVASNT